MKGFFSHSFALERPRKLKPCGCLSVSIPVCAWAAVSRAPPCGKEHSCQQPRNLRSKKVTQRCLRINHWEWTRRPRPADWQGQAPTACASMPPLAWPLRSWEAQVGRYLSASKSGKRKAGITGNTAPWPKGVGGISLLPVARMAPHTPFVALGPLLAQSSGLRVSLLGGQK